MSVTYELNDRIVVIAIERPGRRNAIDLVTARALRAAFQRFDEDDAADVAILYGAGGNFSSGADLKAFDLEDHRDGVLGFTRRVSTKPTIAAIEGYCVAGGLEMALWCDIRVAATNAVFGCFERRFGVPLIDGGTQRLPRLIGEGLALELILTGRAVEADEAHAIGLVNMVTQQGNSLDAAIEWANLIGSHPQATLRTDRLALVEGSGLPLAEALELERKYGNSVMHVARAGADHFATGEGRSGSAVRALIAVPEPEEEDLPWNRVQPVASDIAGMDDESPDDVRESEDVGEADEVGDLGEAGDFGELGESDDDQPIEVEYADPFATEMEEPAAVENQLLGDGSEETALGDAVGTDPYGSEELVQDDPVEDSPPPAVHWEGRTGSSVDLGHDRGGYFIAPVVEHGRAVVLLADLGEGLDELALNSADRLAAMGHSTLAVDLFGAHDRPEHLDPDTVVRLVSSAIETLISGGFAASGTVGLVGFGVGGAMAMWIAGLEERVTSVVAFSPYSPWPEIGFARRLSDAAYLCHQGDGQQPEGAPQAALTEMELRDQGLDATFHVYPRSEADFFRSGQNFNDRMSGVAWQRTELFLDRHL